MNHQPVGTCTAMNATRSPQRSKPAPREQLVETIVIVVLSLCLFSFCLVMFLSMQEHYHKPDTRVTREQLPTFEIPGLVSLLFSVYLH